MLQPFKKTYFERDHDVAWPIHEVLDEDVIARFRSHVLSCFANHGTLEDLPSAMHACIQETVKDAKRYALIDDYAHQNAATLRAILLPGPLESRGSAPVYVTLDFGRHIYTCTVDEFITYLEDIWYPISDDLMCDIPSLDCCVCVTHDGRVFVV